MTKSSRSDKLLHSLKEMAAIVAEHLDADLSLKLWDGTYVPLGKDAADHPAVVITDPGAISSLLRWPTLDRVIRLYAHGKIDFEGGTLIDIAEALGSKSTRRRFKQVPKKVLIKGFLPFLFAPSARFTSSREFTGDQVGEKSKNRNEEKNIQFHYDVSNEFYQLFLDADMVYTCAYFTNWDNSLEQAQHDKLEMTCRKLRLQKGERFLDIGSGWGALICHAARHHGVHAHGVTLSTEQYKYTLERIEREKLGDLVTVELKDYRDVEQKFDKIASIGMYEHIGVSAIPEYLRKVRSLLVPRGLFLNHGITRRSKRKKSRFTARPEQRALVRYIFPGGELDDIGHTLQQMQQARFEIHDVEGWREHYALTTKIWCERLSERKHEAIALVGEQTYRIWVAYLAGCSLAFTRGSAQIFQTLVSNTARGPSPLPQTRSDLYRDRPDSP